MARLREATTREKLVYDVAIYNKQNETSTIYKGATLSFLIQSLKNLEGATKTNAKTGTSVKGSHRNSKNVKPTLETKFKI